VGKSEKNVRVLGLKLPQRGVTIHSKGKKARGCRSEKPGKATENVKAGGGSNRDQASTAEKNPRFGGKLTREST